MSEADGPPRAGGVPARPWRGLRRPGGRGTDGARRDHWRRTVVFTALLLSVWLLVTFVAGWFARELTFDFFGWPFSFWVAAQGSPLVYLLLIGLFARHMNRLDAQARPDRPDPAP